MKKNLFILTLSLFICISTKINIYAYETEFVGYNMVTQKENSYSTQNWNVDIDTYTENENGIEPTQIIDEWDLTLVRDTTEKKIQPSSYTYYCQISRY